MKIIDACAQIAEAVLLHKRFHQVVLLFSGGMVWWMLSDLPVTSHGGFWHYFWPFYAMLIVGIALLEHEIRKH